MPKKKILTSKGIREKIQKDEFLWEEGQMTLSKKMTKLEETYPLEDILRNQFKSRR